MGLENVRLLIVVEQADYRAALSKTFMPEQLYEQLSGCLSPAEIHKVTAAVRWSEDVQAVAIFSCYSDTAYSDRTYLNVGLMGSGIPFTMAAGATDLEPGPKSGLKSGHNANQNTVLAARQRVRRVAEFCPTHLVMCTRSLAISAWAVRNHIRSVALLSDWDEPTRWVARRRHARYVRLLNHSWVSWVGAQGVLASKILEANGVEPAKVIPWEWSQPQLLQPFEPKTIREDTLCVTLVYVGPLTAEAGIDDLLQASLQLQRNGYTVDLQLIGSPLNPTSLSDPAETAWLEAQISAMSLRDVVRIWAGLAPEQMLARVRAADIAVIPQPGPSSATYHPTLPLGVALAMAARTPIVACDHEDLSAYLYHGANAITFPTGSPQSMAHRIERVMGQASLYAQLSDTSQITFDNIKVPARWADLIERWMRDRVYDRQQLHDFALSSGRYDSPIVTRDPFRRLLR